MLRWMFTVPCAPSFVGELADGAYRTEVVQEQALDLRGRGLEPVELRRHTGHIHGNQGGFTAVWFEVRIGGRGVCGLGEYTTGGYTHEHWVIRDLSSTDTGVVIDISRSDPGRPFWEPHHHFVRTCVWRRRMRCQEIQASP